MSIILGAAELAPSTRAGKNLAQAMIPPDTKSLTKKEDSTSAQSSIDYKSAAIAMIPGVVVGGVGAFVWKKHPVLGFLAGHALGSVGYGAYKKVPKTDLLCDLAIEGAAIAGALAWKKHPIGGWLAGAVAATTATAFVPDSHAKHFVEHVKEKIKGKK